MKQPLRNDRMQIRSEAIANIPKGYRLLRDKERVNEHDLYWLHDEVFQEDKGKGKTWQPVAIVTSAGLNKHQDENASKQVTVPLTVGGNYNCAIRPCRVRPFSNDIAILYHKALRWWNA